MKIRLHLFREFTVNICLCYSQLHFEPVCLKLHQNYPDLKRTPNKSPTLNKFRFLSYIESAFSSSGAKFQHVAVWFRSPKKILKSFYFIQFIKFQLHFPHLWPLCWWNHLSQTLLALLIQTLWSCSTKWANKMDQFVFFSLKIHAA